MNSRESMTTGAGTIVDLLKDPGYFDNKQE